MAGGHHHPLASQIGVQLHDIEVADTRGNEFNAFPNIYGTNHALAAADEDLLAKPLIAISLTTRSRTPSLFFWFRQSITQVSARSVGHTRCRALSRPHNPFPLQASCGSLGCEPFRPTWRWRCGCWLCGPSSSPASPRA